MSLHIRTFQTARRIVTALLIVAVTASLVTFAVSAMTDQESTDRSTRNVLLLCLDETGYNTDAIVVISIPRTGSTVSVMQIPRDTYASTGEENCKINRLYYRFYERYGEERQALSAFSEFLARHLAMPIDNSILFSLDKVEVLVDAIGGVDVELPDRLFYQDPAADLTIDLPKGKQHLDGKNAVKLARYRSGYKNGDLGRLDAQKLLIFSIVTKLKDDLSLSSCVKLATLLQKKAITDMSLRDAVSIALFLGKNRNAVELLLFTAPGEATRYYGNTGTWYFSLNKSALSDAASRFFDSDAAEFDPDGIFLGKSVAMQNIYFDTNMKIKEYTASS